MCVQDWNIPQSYQKDYILVQSSSGGTAYTLPEDDGRAGFVVLGPSNGSVRPIFKVNNDPYQMDSIQPSDTVQQRYFGLNTLGPIIQDEVFFQSSAAQDFVIVVYGWPLNPEERDKLAKTGGF